LKIDLLKAKYIFKTLFS